MSIQYDQDLNRFQASQQFFIEFIKNCYKFLVTSLYGSIFFDDTFIVRNNLNPLAMNFVERMIQADDRPSGGRRIFTAMKKGADLLFEANSEVKYPNAILRFIVISGGNDECDKKEQTQVFKFFYFGTQSELIQSLFLMKFQKNLLQSLDILAELPLFHKVIKKDLIFLEKKIFFM